LHSRLLFLEVRCATHSGLGVRCLGFGPAQQFFYVPGWPETGTETTNFNIILSRLNYRVAENLSIAFNIIFTVTGAIPIVVSSERSTHFASAASEPADRAPSTTRHR